ncbi:hypothetical protein ACL655_26290, partial [Klebsiella quasipneumoniae subsp. similipneumoniae]
STRTINWFNKYLKKKYTSKFSVPDGQGNTSLIEHVFLGGDDFYALRCALLHEGSSDISSQRARKILDNFSFVMPGERRNSKHCIQIHGTLMLQVDIFGGDMLTALRQWMEDIKGDLDKEAKVNELLTISLIY